MRSRLLVLVVSLVLPISTALGQSVTADTLRSITAGRRVQVTLQNGDRAVGKLGAVTPTGFTLEGDRRNQPSHDYQYSEVRTVKKKMARSTKWIIAGGVYGALVVIGVILGD